MSISSDESSEKVYNFGILLKKLHQILIALGEFKNQYKKKLNFNKLIKYLKIPNSEIEDIIHLILTFQSEFDRVFREHKLKKTILNGQIYLMTEKKPPVHKENIIIIPETVRIPKKYSKIWSDIIYLFKNIQKGKGFDLEQDSQVIKNLKNIRLEYPYLLLKNGNNLTYPTEIGLELGNLIHTYNKNNKPLKKIKLRNCTFIFD
ncbi:MAG: hypothetical protein ACTSQD_07745 [Promethearchaeota archaeon]